MHREDNDPYTYDRPRTDEELAEIKKHIEEMMTTEGIPYGFAGDTCNDCDRLRICKLAYDPYNTDGDCLYSK